MTSKKITLLICILVIAGMVGGVYAVKKRSADKVVADETVNTLFKQAETERDELGALYQDRIRYLISWRDAVQKEVKKLPADLIVSDAIIATKDFVPKTQDDFNHLDIVQNEVSESLTHYLQSKEAIKKKPDGLEKMEEAINRKRHSYHIGAFKANALMDQYNETRPRLPVFVAERALQNKQLFK